MDKMRQLGMLTAVAVLAILMGGWFLLVSPQRSKVTDLHEQAADQQQKNAALSTQIARLKAESRDLPAEQARLAAIAEQLPANPAMPALVNDLTRAAKGAGVDLQIIAPQTPVAYGSTGTVQLAPSTGPSTGSSGTTGSGASGSGTSSSSSTTSTTSTSSSSSTASTGTSGTTSSTGASTGSTPVAPGAATLANGGAANTGGLYQIPMSVTVVGTYYQLTQFVNRLENLHRAYLVTGLQVQPGDPLGNATTPASGAASTGPAYSGALTAQITGFVFEVLTQAPTTTAPTTLGSTTPSTTSGH